MMGRPKVLESKLFYAGADLDLGARVPANHPLRAVAGAVDFSFVRPLVAPLYGHNGHESLDPSVALRLMFLCFFENVRSERELVSRLPCRLDWLWFCGMGLDDAAPDHSVLSKARRRWGEETFEKVFCHVLGLGRAGGVVGGRTAHADSTLLKADASLDGRVSRVLWEQLERAAEEDGRGDGTCDGRGGGPAPQPAAPQPAAPRAAVKPPKLNERLVSPVDPDAATATRRKGGTTLGYRDHRLVDDRRGVVTATVATAADVDDGAVLPELLARHRDYTGALPEEATGDSMYGTRDNYERLGHEGVRAYLKKRRGKDSPKVSWLKLLPPGCSPPRALYLLGRRRSRAEGSFAEAHARMNHRRCRWRRRWRVQAQCYLVAAAQNLKKLAKYAPLPRAAAAAATAAAA